MIFLSKRERREHEKLTAFLTAIELAPDKARAIREAEEAKARALFAEQQEKAAAAQRELVERAKAKRALRAQERTLAYSDLRTLRQRRVLNASTAQVEIQSARS